MNEKNLKPVRSKRKREKKANAAGKRAEKRGGKRNN